MSRVIVGKLDWARECDRPHSIPKARLSGSKADGLRYERLVAKEFKGAKHGQWYQFSDINGRGYCQPDIVLLQPNRTIVIECKLSDYFAAYTQINSLYKPILLEVYKRPVFGVVVLKWLRVTVPQHMLCHSLDEALKVEGTPIIHWLGKFKGRIAA